MKRMSDTMLTIQIGIPIVLIAFSYWAMPKGFGVLPFVVGMLGIVTWGVAATEIYAHRSKTLGAFILGTLVATFAIFLMLGDRA